MSTFITGADGCAVADGIWSTPSLTLIQELQRELPTTTFFTGADGCTVADGVWCAPSLAFIHCKFVVVLGQHEVRESMLLIASGQP